MRTRQNIWCQYNNDIIPIWKPSQNIWFTLASDIFKTLSANVLKTLASNLVTRLVIIPSVYHNNVGIWYRSNIGAMSGQCCYEVWPTRLCYLGGQSRRMCYLIKKKKCRLRPTCFSSLEGDKLHKILST